MKDRVIKEFDDLRQVGYSRLRVRIIQSEESGQARVDFREFVEGPAFTGWSKRGLRLDAETFDRLLKLAPEITRELQPPTQPTHRIRRSSRGTSKRDDHDGR